MQISFVFAENTRWWAFLSPVIMNISKTDFSHSAILIEQNNRANIFHSEWPNGRCETLKNWQKTYKIKHKFTINVHEDDPIGPRIVYWLRSEVRKPYSIMQLIYIMIYKLMPYSRFYLHKKVINGDYKDICTEFLASFIEEFFHYNFTKSDDLIDLNDVFKAAKLIEERMK